MEFKKRWVIREPITEDVEENLQGYEPLMKQLLFNRNILDAKTAQDFLEAKGVLHDPFLLKDMEKAVDRLLLAVAEKQPIIIYGDYDVDGITATALLVQVLRKLGAIVDKHIPNRFEEGYGLSVETLTELRDRGARVILTADCGIRSPHEVDRAVELGLEIIISDHHAPRDGLPKAYAIINPKQEGDPYPEKNLAGVGVAYKIAEALAIKAPGILDVENWLDFVAIGTIADIVPLTGENRSMAKAGLEILRQGRRKGINSLAAVAKVDIRKITARDIGFMLAPRLNAAGRLESATNAYEILVSEDGSHAGVLAQVLDDQNHKRQDETARIQEEAEKLIEADGAGDYLLFAVDPAYNLGIVGLAAARLVEKYYRPAIVGGSQEAGAAQGTESSAYTRASCRSIPEFHITRALDECGDLFVRHGGHEMAAGFTISNDRLEELKTRLNAIARRELESCDLSPTIYADKEIKLNRNPSSILGLMDKLEPYGMGNSEVLFLTRNLEMQSCWQVGKDKRHLKLKLRSGSVVYDGIAFRQGHWFDRGMKHIDIIYSLERNYYNGQVTMQLNIRDIQSSVIEGDV